MICTPPLGSQKWTIGCCKKTSYYNSCKMWMMERNVDKVRRNCKNLLHSAVSHPGYLWHFNTNGSSRQVQSNPPQFPFNFIPGTKKYWSDNNVCLLTRSSRETAITAWFWSFRILVYNRRRWNSHWNLFLCYLCVYFCVL